MKKILITGITGFVGSRLAKKMLKNNFQVIGIKRPSSSLNNIKDIEKNIKLCDYDGQINSLNKIFEEQQGIYAVLHIASWYLREHKPENINDLIESNVTFSTNLIEACVNNNCNKFINSTSFTEFDESGNYAPDSLYSATKKAFSDIIDYYARCRKLNAITLVLYDNYGENDNRKKLFWLLEDSFKNSRKIDFTAGEQKLSMVHIDDTCDGYLKALQLLDKDNSKNEHLKFFLGGKKYSLKEIVSKYSEITKKNIQVNWGALPYRDNQIMNPYIGDILPGWQPDISLEEGITNISRT